MNRLGQIECNYCGATVRTSVLADQQGWDWFTGFRDDTFHSCAACLSVRGAEFKREREDAHTKFQPIIQVFGAYPEIDPQ